MPADTIERAVPVKVKKKKGLKKKILLGFAGFIAIIVLLTTVANAACRSTLRRMTKNYDKVAIKSQLVPEKGEDGSWYFTTDRDFKVLQLTDVHFGVGYMCLGKDKMALNAVATMVTAEKPDLVIVTGDVAYPIPFQAGTFNNKSGAIVFAELMEQLGVYWTLQFGNHDTEYFSYFDREQIASFYENSGFEHCLFQAGPAEIDGCCNNVIKVKNTEGKVTNAFISLDTNDYTETGFFSGAVASLKQQYDHIHDSQIAWYGEQVKALQSDNKDVNIFAFYHIPNQEFTKAWDEFKANGYQDTEDVQYIDGFMGEAVCDPIEDDNFIETVLELGSTRAILCGHDHVNNWTLRYKGLILSYGNSIDYLAYFGIKNEGSQRGCTVLTCGNGDEEFSIDKYNYYSDRYELHGFQREDVTMQYDGMMYDTDYVAR